MAKHFVSNKDESARLFKSDFMEMFTHVHWSVPIIVYVPVTVFFLYRAANTPGLGLSNIILLFFVGLVFWTLTEYLLHRFVFHYQPKSAVGQRLHFLLHGVHHDYPMDSMRLVMPPSVSIPLAALFYGIFILVMGEAYTAPFFAGFILGYIFYDEIHYATHHAPMKSKLWLWIKHHHILHHFRDPERGFGVSTPLWDYVFGTTYRPEEKAVAEEA
ncbi:MAG: sterol desaturase family protein [Bacteroidota bacterium]|jgi:sterol desaturase/sphingolipid hydroxylase (fatty acid hydroxylase superfamily)